MSDIVERLKYASIRRASETKDEATIRRNNTISDAADEITRLRTALSETEQRAKDAESKLNEETSHRQKLQAALMFWMPSVTEEIERSTNGRCGDDAGLLAGYDGPIDESSWGDEILARAQRARSEALEEAANYHDDLADQHAASSKEERHHVARDQHAVLCVQHQRHAAAIRALIPSEPHDAEGRN